ncbi:putative aldose reductase [Fulvimarina pelagi HTCC2506]|uniref:Putative aldose reductase n=1 Tax=Fulvimarina pelagi HTCC2506 TaxID=314231 RepID=Q0G6B3_9HYPH|nr:aldo/keto reductase [Fulvimarina pelagi]EAU42801.1 putative aldose reductase [Fulvimarina pelagi HTCC2506]
MKKIEAHGASIPALGLGTYTLKGQTCTDIVAKAIEVGYRHIDDAKMYDNEREVGEGIRQSGVARNDLFVTTKVWWTDISREKLLDSARRSIDDLGIGAVDLMLIHWPNPDIALEESIDALNETISEGLTKFIGVANFPSALFREAASMSNAPLVCNQVEYHPHLSQRSVHEACRANDAAIIAYSPIGKGGDLLKAEPILRAAEAHGKSPAQIVLAWHMSQDGVGAIPRTSNPNRLSENIDVFDIALTPEETEAISALQSPDGRLIDPSFAPVWDRD